MDARSIGHEFVRQYYELLHSDPGQLHRFYLDGSVYIHATENQPEEAVVGQQAIFDAISRLNFSDCRTRIRQVDAQQSLQKTYVIQVVGEISNAGRPMRPFVQTFVLAQSAETKFFVSNDIFRYQDHIVAPDAEEPMMTVPPSAVASVEPITNNQVPDYFSKPTESHAHINGEVNVLDTPEPDVQPQVEEQVVPEPEPTQPQGLPEPEPEPIVAAEPSPEAKQEPKAFSWASVASSSSQSSGKKAPFVRAPEQVKPSLPPAAAQPAQPKPQRQRGNGAANGNGAPANGRSGPGSRPNGSVPDNQQIFVGGLNSSMTEEDIKGAFKDFGAAIDIRMTQKQFCFVAFESSQIVDSILANAKEAGFFVRGQRLNVEEKKERAGSSRVANNRQSAGGPTGPRPGRVGASGNFPRGGSANGGRSSRDAAPGRR